MKAKYMALPLKRILWIYLCMFILVVSCQKKQEVAPVKLQPARALTYEDFSREIAFFDALYQSNFDFMLQVLPNHLQLTQSSDLVLNEQALVRDLLQNLSTTYVVGNSVNPNSIAQSFDARKILYTAPPQTVSIQSLGYYTAKQKVLLEAYVNDIVAVTRLSQAASITEKWRNQISYLEDAMSRAEKIELLSIVEFGYVTAKQFSNVEKMRLLSQTLNYAIEGASAERRSSETKPNSGRVMDCAVQWRQVWIAGVVGLATGAVRGALAGCAGGTVAFPGLGTATGCVGGAVMGGATGFAVSAVGKVAAELLSTCGRKNPAGGGQKPEEYAMTE